MNAVYLFCLLFKSRLPRIFLPRPGLYLKKQKLYVNFNWFSSRYY